MKIFRFTICSILISILLLHSFNVTASSKANGVTVKAIIPENQIDKKQTYFDLMLSPGASQELQVEIKNNSNEDKIVSVALNSATTGRNGIINYTGEYNEDESLQYSMSNITKVKTPEIKLKPNSTENAKITITMPKEEIDGIILGGIVINSQSDNDTSTNNGVTIHNEYAYVIGLKISQNDNIVEPDLHLKSIKPASVNHQTSLMINLQNNQPVLMKNMDVSAQIYKKESNDILKSLKLDMAEMAPNSNGSFLIDWNNEKFETGNYRLYMRVKHEDRVWQWDEDFVIDNNVASDINENAIFDDSNSFNIWIILSVVLFIAIIILFIFIFLFYKKSKKECDDEKTP